MATWGLQRTGTRAAVIRIGLLILALILPVLPFGLVNYAASFTRLPLRSYVAGTAVGIVPGSALFVALGASLDMPGSPRFWAALAGLGLFTVAGVLLVRRSAPATAAAA